MTQAHWTEGGYSLFNISVFAGSADNGWFATIGQSNAIFMRRELWRDLGSFGEGFQAPGGGLVNLNALARAVTLPRVFLINLLSEGTFQQIHGSVATNAPTCSVRYRLQGNPVPRLLAPSLPVAVLGFGADPRTRVDRLAEEADAGKRYD